MVAIIVAGFSESAFAFASKELGFVHDTHAELTTHALTEVAGANYPDLAQFQSVIISGGSTEGIGHPGAHTSPDGSIVWWFGNDSVWLDDLTKQYENFNFSQAYKEVGFMVHLTEDIEVPAHQAVTFHGLDFGYSLCPDPTYALCPTALADPNGLNKQAPPPVNYIEPIIGHEDAFESYVSTAYYTGAIVDILNAGADPFGVNLDPNSLSCSWKFWLPHAQSGAPSQVLFWGDYGEGDNSTCNDVAYGDRNDWFSNATADDQKSIAQTQLYAARTNADSLLRETLTGPRPMTRVRQLPMTDGPVPL